MDGRLSVEIDEDLAEQPFLKGSALSRVLREAPYLSRCSDNKTAARVRPREYALRYPYMQINRSGMVSWLIFDLDHPNSFIWDDANLPEPNLIVRNRSNGHSHIYYAISPVCTTEKARNKPITYMKAVYEVMAARLDADTSFHSGPVAKTPNHPWWLTTELHSHVYELGELAEYVELPVLSPWRKTTDLDDVSHSRHCLLFEMLRNYAYSIVNREREEGSLTVFHSLLEAHALNSNSFQKFGFSENLPYSSIKATVRSVARWTWSRYHGDRRCHRGAMRLDKNLPLEERQRQAAARTHELRQKSTESKIRGACRRLQEEGTAVTQVAIAKLAKLSRQTVASYKHILVEARKSAVVVLLDPRNDVAIDVKYGVHQIAAAFGAFDVKSVRSESRDVKSVRSESRDVKSVRSESRDVKSVRSESRDVKSVRSESRDVKSVRSESRDVKSVRSESRDVKSVRSQTWDP